MAPIFYYQIVISLIRFNFGQIFKKDTVEEFKATLLLFGETTLDNGRGAGVTLRLFFEAPIPPPVIQQYMFNSALMLT